MNFSKGQYHHANEWIDYVKSLPEPRDDIARMRNHYLCRYYFTSRVKKIILNTAAFPVMVFSMIGTLLFQIAYLFKKREKACDAIEFVIEGNTVATLEQLGSPDEIRNQYQNIITYKQKRGKALFVTGKISTGMMAEWIRCAVRYPFSFFMNLTLFTHLTVIAKIIWMYHPKAIITTEAENDFTSSVMTHYCEGKEMEYICVMHGEYLLSVNHAFVRFSWFYVWDEYYISQFETTRSSRDFFRTYLPARFKLNIPEEEKRWDLTYYLQDQTEEEMRKIKEDLEILTGKGFRCNMRPHPSATDMKLVNQYFANSPIHIENGRETSLIQSFARTRYIVSQYSTVLSEAYINQLEAVIDDHSNPALYEQLKQDMYINIHRIKLKMSDLVGSDA